jgi:hypothetical protein
VARAAAYSILIPIVGAASYFWQLAALETGVLPLLIFGVAAGPVGLVLGIVAIRAADSRREKVAASAGLVISGLYTAFWLLFLLTFAPR